MNSPLSELLEHCAFPQRSAVWKAGFEGWGASEIEISIILPFILALRRFALRCAARRARRWDWVRGGLPVVYGPAEVPSLVRAGAAVARPFSG